MKLNAAARRKIPAGEYGLAAERKYPMPDRQHAGLAKAYATKEARSGYLSLSQLAKIRGKANRVLAKN